MLVTPYLNSSPPKSPPQSSPVLLPNLLLDPSGGDLGGDGRRKVTLTGRRLGLGRPRGAAQLSPRNSVQQERERLRQGCEE